MLKSSLEASIANGEKNLDEERRPRARPRRKRPRQRATWRPPSRTLRMRRQRLPMLRHLVCKWPQTTR